MAEPTKAAPHHIPRTTRAGPPLPHVSRFHRWSATALGATLWFWLMYRAKQDGPVLLGWKKPWEH